MFQAVPDELPTADGLYHDMVMQAGLYGQAFFGHRATGAERALLRRLWSDAQKQAKQARDAHMWLNSRNLPVGW